MKIIHILIAAFALLYASLKGYAQTEKDTISILYKGKSYKIDTHINPEEEEKSKTLKFIDTMKKSMVIVTVSSKAHDGGKDNLDNDSSKASLQKRIVSLINYHDSAKKRRFIETRFLPALDLGLASTMNDVENANAYTPRLGKSLHMNLGIISQNMNLYRERLLLSYGFSLNNYYLKYNDRQAVQYVDGQGLLGTRVDSSRHIYKNRMDVRYLSVPVLLEYHSRNDKFRIAAGIELGFNGRTRLTLKGEDENSMDFRHKAKTNVKISPEQINAVLKIGIHDICIYGRYSITEMYAPSAYAAGENPGQHLFSFGICLFGI